MPTRASDGVTAPGKLRGQAVTIGHFCGNEMNHASDQIIEHVKLFLSMREVPQTVSPRDKLTMPYKRLHLIRI
jgi:hypothetical protein